MESPATQKPILKGRPVSPNAQGLCCTPRSAPMPRQSPPTWARLPSHAPMFPASEHVAVGEFQMQPLTPSLQRRVC